MLEHRTIGMRPVDARDSRKTLGYGVQRYKDRRFKVGNLVRVSKYKMVFEKGYTNWNTEVFKIVKVQRINPVTHLFEDYLLVYSSTKSSTKTSGKFIAGAFYEYVASRDSSGYMEKVLRRRGNEIYVK